MPSETADHIRTDHQCISWECGDRGPNPRRKRFVSSAVPPRQSLTIIVHRKCFFRISEQQCSVILDLLSVDFKHCSLGHFLNSDRAEQFRRCFPQHSKTCITGILNGLALDYLSTIILVVGLDITFLIAHLCVARSVWHWEPWACLAHWRRADRSPRIFTELKSIAEFDLRAFRRKQAVPHCIGRELPNGDDPRTDQRKGVDSNFLTAKQGRLLHQPHSFSTPRCRGVGTPLCGRPAGFLSLGTVGQWPPATLPWRTVRKGGDPKTDQEGTTRTPGWQPEENHQCTPKGRDHVVQRSQCIQGLCDFHLLDQQARRTPFVFCSNFDLQVPFHC